MRAEEGSHCRISVFSRVRLSASEFLFDMRFSWLYLMVVCAHTHTYGEMTGRDMGGMEGRDRVRLVHGVFLERQEVTVQNSRWNIGRRRMLCSALLHGVIRHGGTFLNRYFRG